MSKFIDIKKLFFGTTVQRIKKLLFGTTVQWIRGSISQVITFSIWYTRFGLEGADSIGNSDLEAGLRDGIATIGNSDSKVGVR